MYSEVELVHSLANNQYEPEELEEILKNFRIGWCEKALHDYAIKDSEKRRRFRMVKDRLFDSFFSEFVSWFDDRVSDKKEELVKNKFNYQNYRKPRRQRYDQRKVRRSVPRKQN